MDEWAGERERHPERAIFPFFLRIASPDSHGLPGRPGAPDRAVLPTGAMRMASRLRLKMNRTFQAAAWRPERSADCSISTLSPETTVGQPKVTLSSTRPAMSTVPWPAPSERRRPVLPPSRQRVRAPQRGLHDQGDPRGGGHDADAGERRGHAGEDGRGGGVGRPRRDRGLPAAPDGSPTKALACRR